MNIFNATTLRLELIKFVCFLQTLSPIQLSALSQFVQFEDKEQKWPLQQLHLLLEKSSPEQVEQIVSLTARRMDEASPEARASIDALSTSLSVPVSQVEAAGPLFQTYQLQDLLQSFSYVQLMKFFEIVPPGTQIQQLQLLQQLQQLFGHLQPEIVQNLHQEVQDAFPEQEQQQLAQSLQLPPDHFHLYQPLRSLLHMELRELLSFQEILPKLQPIQMLQLLQMLQLQPYDLIELKKMFVQQEQSIVSLPFEFQQEPMEMEQEEKTLTLQIVDQPPEKAVYKRNVKPNPSVLLVGDNDPQEGELVVFATLIRCDTFAEEHRFLNGNRPMPITAGRVVTFRKLKILVTSHQQGETLFSLRFELRRKRGENEFETISSVTTNPIMVLSHSTQMKPVPAAVPVISEVIPGTGPATGGTRVAILGSNFADTPALRIRFDNSDVMPEFKGPGTLVCHTPQHAPGPVVVRVANGNAWSESACTFTYADPYRNTGSATSGIVPMLDPLQMTYGWDVSSIQARSAGGVLSLNGVDTLGYAPLHYTAAAGNDTGATQLLLAHHPFLDVRDLRGNTPLHWAVAFNNDQQVELLLRHNAPCNSQNLIGGTPLHWACAQGSQDLVSFLVESGGALVNIEDVDGATPLHVAAATGHTSIVKYLLAHGAYLYAEDDYGDTPIHYAVREAALDVMKVLVDVHRQLQGVAHASPHHHMPCNEDGESPLHLAASIGSAQIVDLLIRHQDTPINVRDVGGWTALHHAVAGGYDNVVRVMISHRGSIDLDLNSCDWEGYTPLHLACQIGHEEIALRLIIAGADPRHRDTRGLTPLNHSRAVSQKAELLRSSPAFASSIAQQQELRRAREQQQQQGNNNNNNNNNDDVDIDKLMKPLFMQHRDDETPRPPFMRTVMSWLGRAFLKGEPLDAPPIHTEI